VGHDQPLAVERHPTPHRESGRGGDRPRAIVAHTTVGSYASAVAWFARPESGVSAHYLVGLDGRIAQFVEERDTARHAGRVVDPTAAMVGADDDPNRFTIGIEFEDGGDPEGVARTSAQYRAGGRLIAAIAARWDIPLDRAHLIAHREIRANKTCPGNLDLDRLLAAARSTGAPWLAVLLAARNEQADMPGWLDGVAGLADAVVALDDGSTDDTGAILEASPPVEVLLANPRRERYAGWDDGANRRRLLEAAAELEPDWVLFLDADERMDAEDVAALRSFLASDALPGLAYGLALFRMWGEERCVREPSFVYRMFAPARGQTLPADRLHFNPVPASIPPGAWVRTTLRLRHLDSPERLARRRAKYREADPTAEWDRSPARLLDEPSEPLIAWRSRPADLPVLRPDPAPEAIGAGEAHQDGGDRPLLIALLPARNCADLLPGYLECVGRFADAMVALDDGSTDDTGALLEASPLVEALPPNSRREGYAGWDDAANRGRLLDAAIERGARWVLFLDADERMDADDADALRNFVAHEADPGRAYGFRVFRMVGDEEHYDRAGLWVYRLFAPAAGQALPAERLHLVPVPTSIPRSRWRRTTFRIKHLAGMTAAAREARVRKYAEADPERAHQFDYARLLEAPQRLRPWRPRPPDLPALADPGGGTAVDLETLDLDAPLLSAIVIARGAGAQLERAVRSVLAQECSFDFEVIVAVSGAAGEVGALRRRLPGAQVVEVPEPGLPGGARNAGLAVARGLYVSFPGSHVELPQGSLAARMRAHELGHPMVTGSAVNGTDTPSGWAAYFLDHSSSLAGRPSGQLHGAPARCSYERELLDEVGGFPEHLRAGEDTVVNQELWRRGLRAYRAADVTYLHRNPCPDPWRLARHHFGRGRAFGRILAARGAPGRRAAPAFAVRYARRRLRDTAARVHAWGTPEERARFERVRGLVGLGVAAAALGTLVELAGPRRAG